MRNKKFLALAMAAVVGMTSAPAVYNNVVVAEAAVGDATVKNVSITGGYGTANSGDEAMTGDFELVYTFTNKTQDASTNWFNYGVEVHNGVGGFISTRADNYGWLANDWNTDGSVMSWGDGAESWDDFREVMKDASVKVTVKREGNTVTVANDITGNADSSKKYNFVAQLLSVSKFVGIDSLIKKSALRLEKERKRLFSAKNELEVFESNLAYLILSEKIAFPDELGFSSEYVKKLLTNKKKEVENYTVEYSYNESTGKTYEVINGKYYALSHTPRVITDKLRQNRQQVVGEKSLIIR